MQVELDLKANVKRWWIVLMVVVLINILPFKWIAGFCTGVFMFWRIWIFQMMWYEKESKGKDAVSYAGTDHMVSK